MYKNPDRAFHASQKSFPITIIYAENLLYKVIILFRLNSSYTKYTSTNFRRVA